jgi:hypothetical protein
VTSVILFLFLFIYYFLFSIVIMFVTLEGLCLDDSLVCYYEFIGYNPNPTVYYSTNEEYIREGELRAAWLPMKRSRRG